MKYSLIDSAIRTWAAANSLHLYEAFAGREERYCYISSPEGECLQIAIQAPADGCVKIEIWAVETNQDRDVHQVWVGAVASVEDGLQWALTTAHEILGDQ